MNRICTACGTQYPLHAVPEVCTICKDDRQYIPEQGQTWISHEELLSTRSVRIRELNSRVYELEITPHFAIGQRALLILSPQGNILWDCIALLDETAVDFIQSKGGLKAIAFSHPHYYSNMNDWAETFDCPVYIHQRDEQWIMDKGKHISLWDGAEQLLWEGMRIINIGGHFPGSSILHVPFLSKEGAVFTGDTLYVAPSKKHIAVMYSYPNKIPLPLAEVARIKARFEAIPFDTLYGFYSYQNLFEDVKQLMKESLERYL
jgi:glyoxylase-like metal-dependent hydrolase (beta-lactamase superfamily II)